ELQRGIVDTQRQLDEDAQRLDALKTDVRTADADVAELREQADKHEAAIREARKALEAAQVELGELEVSRATQESHLAHLAESCQETLEMSLDAVVAEIAAAGGDGLKAGATDPTGSADLQVGQAEEDEEAEEG